MLITTNLEFGRLVHHSHLLIFDGERQRVRNSLMRR